MTSTKLLSSLSVQDIRRESRWGGGGGGEMGEFSSQPGFGSITLLQKFTPHFKILDPRLDMLFTLIFVDLRMSVSERLR